MEKKFLDLIKEVLEIENRELQLSDNFRELDEWDSLANLSLIAMLDDEFGVVIEADKFKQMSTFQDIFDSLSKS